MAKIAFMGAGSTVFARNVLGDCMCSEVMRGSKIALYDIDADRLADSAAMLDHLNGVLKAGMTIESHLGVGQRKAALRGADYVVNAVQVGGYEPSTVIDFEIPKRYGLRQTIADTLGIGGIFRTLRTLPVVLDFGREMQEVCPNALFINYSNPMAMLMMGFLRGTGLRGVGLCHSVQGCAPGLVIGSGLADDWGAIEKTFPKFRWKVAGINHQGWLLEIADGEKDLYPEIKRRWAQVGAVVRTKGVKAIREEAQAKHGDHWWTRDLAARMAGDAVRLEVMGRFGYYVTESSEHSSEYMPWFIKRTHPELIERYGIPLDEYPRRCVSQIEGWKAMRNDLVGNKSLTHSRTGEYASYIMEAVESNKAFTFGGNVMNTGLITNLPAKACVEVLCVADRAGVRATHVGDLPEQCAALNRTNVNVQILTVEAVLTGRKDAVYQAALLDPHTSAELSIDETVALCDDLFAAHGEMIPKMR